MPAKKASISINLLADATKAKAGFAEAEKAAGGLDKQFGNIAKTAVNAFATREIINFGKGAVGAASDLAESANAVSVSFGDAADRILKLGENASTAVGLSAKDFNGFAVQFAGFTRQLTSADKDIVDVTDELTVRIADFASVMNLDVPDAATKFQSALAGSTEPMRAFGIDVSAAAVQTYALENGITSNAAAMTEAEKVQARYGLIMEQTAQMSGDFANTSDGLANSQRILAAEMENAKATIGEAMVPALQGVMGVVKPVLEAFTALPEEMQQVIVLATAGAFGFRSFSNTLKGFNVRIGTANVLTGTLAVTMSSLAIALNEIAKRQDNVTQGISAMQQAIKESNGVFDNRARRIIENELLTGELGNAIQLLGIDLDDMTQAALGDADAIDRVKEATKAALPQGIDFGYVLRGTIGLLNDEEEAARLVRDTLKGYTEQLGQTARDQQRLSDNVDETDAEMRRFMDIIESDNIYNFTEDVTEAATGMSELRKQTFKTDVELDRLFGRLDDDQAIADFIQELTDANEVLRTAKEGSAEYEQAVRDQMFALQELEESHSRVNSQLAQELIPVIKKDSVEEVNEELDRLLGLIGQIPAEIQLAIDAGSLGLSIAELQNLSSTVYGLGRQPGAQDGFTTNVYISAGVITDPVELGKTTVEAINEYYAIGGSKIVL
jgi:hypothetical protein